MCLGSQLLKLKIKTQPKPEGVQRGLWLLGECLTPTPGGRQSQNQNRSTGEPGLRGTSTLLSKTVRTLCPWSPQGTRCALLRCVCDLVSWVLRAAERVALRVPGALGSTTSPESFEARDQLALSLSIQVRCGAVCRLKIDTRPQPEEGDFTTAFTEAGRALE